MEAAPISQHRAQLNLVDRNERLDKQVRDLELQREAGKQKAVTERFLQDENAKLKESLASARQRSVEMEKRAANFEARMVFAETMAEKYRLEAKKSHDELCHLEAIAKPRTSTSIPRAEMHIPVRSGIIGPILLFNIDESDKACYGEREGLKCEHATLTYENGAFRAARYSHKRAELDIPLPPAQFSRHS